mmetsp:Transcript_108936/g.172100  ORF Transcript_108936/g.172100 Transcript_108936/m.172100 type:complete len:84 (+) Transcript_108936:3-254(+)
MAKIPPNASRLPAMIGLQDNFGGDMQDAMPELDCLREKWLEKLLPGPSSFEDAAYPPNLCSSWKRPNGAEPRGKNAKARKQEL